MKAVPQPALGTGEGVTLSMVSVAVSQDTLALTVSMNVILANTGLHVSFAANVLKNLQKVVIIRMVSALADLVSRVFSVRNNVLQACGDQDVCLDAVIYVILLGPLATVTSELVPLASVVQDMRETIAKIRSELASQSSRKVVRRQQVDSVQL